MHDFSEYTSRVASPACSQDAPNLGIFAFVICYISFQQSYVLYKSIAGRQSFAS